MGTIKTHIIIRKKSSTIHRININETLRVRIPPQLRQAAPPTSEQQNSPQKSRL